MLRVHGEYMRVVDSAKYLGNIITSKGSEIQLKIEGVRGRGRSPPFRASSVRSTWPVT